MNVSPYNYGNIFIIQWENDPLSSSKQILQAFIIIIALCVTHSGNSFLWRQPTISFARENFWIGIRLPSSQVRLDEVQGDIADKFKAQSGSKIRFKRILYPHITLAEGSILDAGAKNRIKKLLGSVKWQKALIRFHDTGAIFGKPERFIVLTVNQRRSKNLFDLAQQIRNALKNERGIKLKMAKQKMQLHVSLGTIWPNFSQLSLGQKNKVRKIVDDLNVTTIKRYPRAATSLSKFKIDELKFVVTPKNVRLSPKQLVSPQYVQGTYKAQ